MVIKMGAIPAGVISQQLSYVHARASGLRAYSEWTDRFE
jgi:hypothetical protein